MLSKTLLVALAATGAAAVPKYNSSLDMAADLKTDSITAQTLAQWCSAQTSSCSALCNKANGVNSCSTEDLTFNCTCSNGPSPDLTLYKQTLPTLICEELFKQCINSNVGNSTGQRDCNSNIMKLCGTAEPKASDEPTTTSSDSTSDSTQAASSTGSSSTSTQKGIAAATMAAGQGLAAAAAAVGVFAYLI